MTINTRSFIVAALVLVLTAPAYAQVCQEPGQSGTGKANLSCDMNYRNTVVACDSKDQDAVLGTRPSCPPKPMPMITTPKRSYIADYTPYLFAYPRDAKDPTRPYAGAYVVGTPGDASKTFQMFGNTAPGTKRIAACTAQLKVPNDPTSVKDEARINRLQLDNCTNQYILNSAIYPYQKEATNRLLSLDDPANPGKMIDLKSECQPLRMFQETQGEYNAGEYLQWAWKKTLQDPDQRKTTGSVKNVPCIYTDVNHELDYLIPCDREPHLPEGVTLDNKIDPPDPFPEVLLPSIGAVPYEEILDPTHPFSPRWDFTISDRDYALETLAHYANPTAIAIYDVMMDDYMSEPKGTIFCAGVKKADSESDAQKKADALVPVDLLEFRRPAFEKAQRKRAMYNYICKEWTANFTSGDDALFYVLPLSFCYQITGFSIWYPWIFAKDFDCWECFGLDGKVDDENQHPPCTHNYLGKDLKMKKLPGGLNGLSRSAQCGTEMDKVCRDMRKPYTQLNKLKMRYHNPDDDDDSDNKNAVLTAGAMGADDPDNAALEGTRFKEYFGNHMPYPKLWDIGTSLQKTASSDGNDQPPLDTTGQYTTIVGVGREAAAKNAANGGEDADGQKLEEKYTDQRCKTMGWGGFMGVSMPPPAPEIVTVGGANIYLPDPMTSWTEMKLYQTRTMRNVGLSCIGRYEKVFKPGSSENLVLMATGAEWSKLIVTKCARDKNGRTKDCTFMTLKEFTDAGSPATDDSTIYLKQVDSQGWPNGWRGYMASDDLIDPTEKNKFPNFGGGSSMSLSSIKLDDAKKGDIILMPSGPKNNAISAKDHGLAKLALVVEVNNKSNSDCEDKKNCYVKVLEGDNGKFPDVCGTTDTWGEMKSRYYFKPGMLPEQAQAEYKKIKSTGDCIETRLLQCEMSAWNQLQIYRIKDDVRKGCENKSKASDCYKDE